MRHFRYLLVGLLACASGSLPAVAANLAVEHGEYKLKASFDSEVTTDLETEEWARVWRPVADGHYPLVLFLHGNHGTCGHYDSVHKVRIDDDITYTYTGTCPQGYVVTPNHGGYDYLAEDLAARGYVVVSINANRGINGADGDFDDPGLNLRRGRLVLRHMEYLSQWNSEGGAPKSLGFQLTNILDFNHVGLMGHSRGGEGMRAAVAQYQDAGSPWPARIGTVNFEALFEIGPVDGQTSRVLNNTGLQWNVLLPGCDGDVADLQGLRPYDRGLLITTESAALNKSTFEVFGANHNFYNTEWQLSDADGCDGQTPLFTLYKGSKPQRETARGSVIPFFLAHLGASARLKKARMFDPSYPLSKGLTSVTLYARGFTPAPHTAENFIVDNFDQATGTSSEGVPNQAHNLTQYAHGAGSFNDDPGQRAAAINWSSKGAYLQVNAAQKGSAVDISAYPALEFRVALRCFGTLCSMPSDPSGDVDFSILLADSNDKQSAPVTLKSVAVVARPAGAYWENMIFQTVRIPVDAFAGADPAGIRGVRFAFNKTTTSSIYIADVRFTKTPAGPGGLVRTLDGAPRLASLAISPRRHGPDSNRIASIREAGGRVEIELTSSRTFPIGDALPTLAIGDRSFHLSRFAVGKADRIFFRISPADYAAVPDGAEVTLRIGGAHPWSFGGLRK